MAMYETVPLNTAPSAMPVIAGVSPLTGIAQPPAPQPGAGSFWNNSWNGLQGLLGGFFDKVDPTTEVKTPGWGLPAIQGVAGLGNLWLGMKQYGLAKDQLAQSRREFDMNWGANRTLTNAQLADRQAARVASNPTAYQSVGDYMAQNGIR